MVMSKTATSILLCAVVGGIPIQRVQAANYWFDNDGVTPGFGMTNGGAYDWTAGTPWTTSTAGDVAGIAWPGGTNQAGLVGSGVAGDSYTIRLGAAGNVNVVLQNLGLNWNLTNATPISDGNAVIGNPGDTGELRLNADNSFGTAAGTLTINNPYNLQTRASNFRGGNVVINGLVSGTGRFLFAAGGGLTSGTLTLANTANTHSGRTNADYVGLGYTLAVTRIDNGGVASSLGTSSANIGLNGGRLKFIGTGAQTSNLGLHIASGGAILEAAGATSADTFSFSGAPTYTAANSARAITLTGVNTGDNTLAFVFGNNGTGVNTLTKNGTGTWVLSQANTFTGATKINDGILKLTNNLALQNSPLDTSGAGVLDLGATNTPTLGGLTNTGNLILPANVTSLTLNNGTGAGLSYGGGISGGAAGLALIKTGANTQTLAGANTHSGATTVSGGMLIVSHPGALGGTAGDTLVNAGFVLKLTNGVTVSGETIRISGNGGGAGVGNFNGALQAETGASAIWDGPVVINSADARVGAGVGGTLELRGAIINGGANSVLNVGAGSGGTGAVVVSAAAGINTYTGATIITRGTLRLGAPNTLPVASLLDIDNANAGENSILDLNGFDQTIGGLQRTNTGGGAGGSIITNQGGANATLTVDQAGSTSYSGVIQDGTTHPVLLVKKGAGTLALSGNNSFNGSTLVEGGVLRVNGLHSGTGLITASSGATLGGSGILTGDTSVADAVLSPGAAAATGGTFTFGNLALGAASTLEFDLADPFSLADDVLSVGGTLTLAGVLNVNELAGFDAPSRMIGEKWLLATYGGPALGTHALTLGSAPALSSGLHYEIDINAPGEVYLAVVPEAGTAGLLACGLLALAIRLRRR